MCFSPQRPNGLRLRALFSPRSHSFKGLLLMSLLGLAASRPTAAQTTTVYSNNFTNGAGSEFSNNSTSTTPGTAAHAADKFLGEFGNQATTLTLAGLATHTQVNVTFDLYMIRSMDGNGPFGGGPDPWSVAENGSTLLSTNFANFPGDTQSFGGLVIRVGAGDARCGLRRLQSVR